MSLKSILSHLRLGLPSGLFPSLDKRPEVSTKEDIQLSENYGVLLVATSPLSQRLKCPSPVTETATIAKTTVLHSSRSSENAVHDMIELASRSLEVAYLRLLSERFTLVRLVYFAF
jgi:hypothetical protein